MKKLLVVLLAVALVAVSAVSTGVAVADPDDGPSLVALYGVNAHDDGLSIIDPDTGVVNFIGPLNPDPNIYMTPVAMAVRPSDGELFVWSNSSNSETDGVLLTVDRCTGNATPVEASTAPQGILQALAFAPDGTLYGLESELFTINPSSGEKTLVGALNPAVHIYAADFNAAGTLYGVATSIAGESRLFTINTSSAEATVVATLSQDIGIIGSIVFDGDGNLIGSGFSGPSGDILFDIDTTDGTVSNIVPVLADQAPQGMGFASPLCAAKAVLGTEDMGDGDGILELGEEWSWAIAIMVTNPSSETIEDVVLQDNLGGDLKLVGVFNGSDWEMVPEPTNKKQTWDGPYGLHVQWTGKTLKAHLTWDVGDLAPGAYFLSDIWVATDINTGTGNGKNPGHQEYTSIGLHELNSGAYAEGYWDGTFVWDKSDPIMVEVFEDT